MAFYKGSKTLPLSVVKWQKHSVALASSSASDLGINPRIFGLQGLVLPLTLFSLTAGGIPPRVCHTAARSQLHARGPCSKSHIPGFV